MTTFPDKRAYLALCRRQSLVPLCVRITADLETPVSAFAKVCGRQPFSFLFESVEGQEAIARYSFLGTAPFASLRCTREQLEVGGLQPKRKRVATPWPDLRRLLRHLAFRLPDERLPRFFGGAVGYVGYGAVRYVERIPLSKPDNLGLPDLWFFFPKIVLVFDHFRHTLILVASLPHAGDPEGAYQESLRLIERVRRRLKSSITLQPHRPRRKIRFRPETDRDVFLASVRRIVREIRNGECIQTVLSQRFRAECESDDLTLYRAARLINPSPYLFLLRMQGCSLVGSSPELLLRVQDGIVSTRPIAGTRPRHPDPARDKALEAQLLRDPKEIAEHVMLVDLGRNDLGKVCRYGSVGVSEYMSVERFSHVMHIVSQVEGRLKRGEDAVGAFQAAFPAGTVTGAPKVRAMELIEEHEPFQRGPYAGAVGYFGYGGNCDTAITIRTLLKTGTACYVQAGAGIVADSKPVREYEETLAKAQALFRAVSLAERGLEL